MTKNIELCEFCEEVDSSFSFAPSPLYSPATAPTDDFTVDIRKYIPAGCVRIWKSDCAISSEVWKSCQSWRAFAHPRDVYSLNQNLLLLNGLQELLFSSKTLQPYRGLHNAEWIKLEFKMRDQCCGQVRVYILPDDVGRSLIPRVDASLRRAMRQLLAQIDISGATWLGEWLQDTPVSHADRFMNETGTKDDTSLLHIFNTLPSPQPDPMAVSDDYARFAMQIILEGDIPGLKTKMFTYQRRSTALMLQRETQPDQNIDPRLRVIIDQKGEPWYCDLDLGVCLVEPRKYEAPRGGICAETMGLGKTLICLALILATKHVTSKIPAEYSVGTIPVRKTTSSLIDMAAAAIGRLAVPFETQLVALEVEGYDFARCREALKKGAGHYFIPGPEPRRQSRKRVVVHSRKIWLSAATLVIVPSNLVQQWRHEIQKHTSGLRVLVVTMKSELPCSSELADYDIILFSNARFVKEARDGLDTRGRKSLISPTTCQCPYIGATRTRNCTCFREEDVYHSPLKNIHFKRLITDEGHTFGNASKASKTEAMTVLDFLQLSARWIISGTPTQGLYGIEVSTRKSEQSMFNSTRPSDTGRESRVHGAYRQELPDLDEVSQTFSDVELLMYKQERIDLEKLGNIATVFLKARPWSNTYHDKDSACWAQHVMQPRHGPKSHGNMDCLKATLKGMIIRHRPEDVLRDIALPPLHQETIYLNGSIQNQVALNIFALMIVTNAITSERKDADYFFHSRQRKALLELVANLRQASFFWSGTPVSVIRDTLDIAKRFFMEHKAPLSSADKVTLQLAIRTGEAIVSNEIFRTISKTHEMPMYIENQFPDNVRKAWALDGAVTNPTLMGQAMVHEAQRYVEAQLWKENPMDGLAAVGKQVMSKAMHQENQRKLRSSGTPRNIREAEFILDDGVKIHHQSSPKKQLVRSSGGRVSIFKSNFSLEKDLNSKFNAQQGCTQVDTECSTKQQLFPRKSALKTSVKLDVAGTLDPTSPLGFTSIVSTASAKLSYLIDAITKYHILEKIIVFYEVDNVAYYIAQALECLGVKHLIYAKALSSERRSQYVVTFNKSETFRVLLMDVSQAAFGLDLSSASRIYFINPVFNPQVEAQAIKRAHRIGQTKPVYVETLVLRGSIEEVIMERRQSMSTEEHKKCKNILDDQAVYDWIRNAKFIPGPCDGVSGPEQMAKLKSHHLVFCRAGARSAILPDSDADLILDEFSAGLDDERRCLTSDKRLATETVKAQAIMEERDRPHVNVPFSNASTQQAQPLELACSTEHESRPSPADSTWSGFSDIPSPTMRLPSCDMTYRADSDEILSSMKSRINIDTTNAPDHRDRAHLSATTADVTLLLSVSSPSDPAPQTSFDSITPTDSGAIDSGYDGIAFKPRKKRRTVAFVSTFEVTSNESLSSTAGASIKLDTES